MAVAVVPLSSSSYPELLFDNCLVDFQQSMVLVAGFPSGPHEVGTRRSKGLPGFDAWVCVKPRGCCWGFLCSEPPYDPSTPPLLVGSCFDGPLRPLCSSRRRGGASCCWVGFCSVGSVLFAVFAVWPGRAPCARSLCGVALPRCAAPVVPVGLARSLIFPPGVFEGVILFGRLWFRGPLVCLRGGACAAFGGLCSLVCWLVPFSSVCRGCRCVCCLVVFVLRLVCICVPLGGV